MITTLLIASLLAGILYDRWSLKVSSSRSVGNYYWDNQGVHFDDVTKRELRSSSIRELPFFFLGAFGIYGLYFRPGWLQSSVLLGLCAVAAGIFLGMVFSGGYRAVKRFL